MRAVAPPSLSLPEGGGALQGLGQAAAPLEITGTFGLTVPLPVSPCRGFEPALLLSYHSGDGQGPFGLGFSLSLSSITRRTSQGIPRYDRTDVFVFDGAELVPDAGGSVNRTLDGKSYSVTRMHPRVETFEKLERFVNVEDESDCFWRSIDSTNTVQYFGRTSQARVADPADPTHVFEWLIEEAADARGDRVCYQYKADGSERLPARILYGNDTPEGEDWHFEVVIDYGERDEAYHAVRDWPERLDSMRSFQAGFERRTRRLCRAVMLFHRFDELGPDPVLVQLTRLIYDESASLSLLKRLEQVGCIDSLREPRPPLELAYAPFAASAQAVTLSAPPDASFLDLDAQGVPGLFVDEAHGGPLYWPARANGDYGPPQRPPSWPGGGGRFADVCGTGCLDLLRSTAPAGFFAGIPGGGFAAFARFSHFPADANAPGRVFVDFTGSGLTDIAIIDQDFVSFYPSLGAAGYGPLQQVARTAGLPMTIDSGPQQFLAFSPFFGTGGQHRVSVMRNAVTVWPHLGYGRFASPVEVAGAPDLGEDFDASRVMLCDLDGSGTPDVAYVRPECVEIYSNRCGASLATDPIKISLPAPCGSPSQVTFADVYGGGYECLVFTESPPQPGQLPRRWCWDLCAGTKPYLLTLVNDNAGERRAITYRSSTYYWLRDQEAGKPWVTCLPFPVQVVAAIDCFDDIAGTHTTASFSYAHGYYDGIEREFRGFGRIERADTQALLNGEISSEDPPGVSPPVLTRTWYYTGAGGDLARFAAEFYAGDAQAWSPPTDCMDPGTASDAETLRQARVALHGCTLREEVYGLDSADPFGISLYSHWVRIEQPLGSQPYAVFSVFGRETIDYDYERVPTDPRITHSYILAVDALGQLQRTATFIYPRRAGAVDAVPEQFVPKLLLNDTVYVVPLTQDDALLFGLPSEAKSYEVTAPSLLPTVPLSADTLLGFLNGGPSMTLLSWERFLYYDGSRGLLKQTLAAELDAHQVVELFGALPLEGDLDSFMVSRGGYLLEYGYWWVRGAVTTYSESFSLVQSVTDVFGTVTQYEYDSHSLLLTSIRMQASGVLDTCQVAGDLDYVTLIHGSLKDDNGAVSEMRVDSRGRVVACSRNKPGEAGFAGLSTWKRPDAAALEDVLENPTAYLQGAASFHLYESLVWAGQVSPAAFPQPGLWDDLVAHDWVSREGVILSAFRALSGADAFTLSAQFEGQRAAIYSTLAAVACGEPCRSTSVLAQTLPGDTQPRAAVSVTHYDGLGRVAQVSTLAGPGQAFILDSSGQVTQGHVESRWLATGSVLYDSRGNPFREYEPYFVSTPHFVTHPALTRFGFTTTLHRDPLGSVVRIDEPRGPLADCGVYETRSLGAWSRQYSDSNDTVKTSPLYQLWAQGAPADGVSPFEVDALEKAAAHDGTPDVQILDNLGRIVRMVRQDRAGGPALTTRAGLDIDGRELWCADPRLDAAGKTNFQYTYSLGGRVLQMFSSDSGARLVLHDALGRMLLGQDARGFLVLHSYDGLGRTTSLRVRGPGGFDSVVERVIYGDSVDSTGAVPFPSPESVNLRGQVYRHYDAAGLLETASFNCEGSVLSQSARLRTSYVQEPDWSGESPWTQLLPALDAQLDSAAPFVTVMTYDAVQRIIAWTDPLGHAHGCNYNLLGLATSESLDGRTYGRLDDYDAQLRPLQITYGNSALSQFEYEAATDRLKTARCMRGDLALHVLTYYYDPVGNVTHVQNLASPVSAGELSADADHTYDALYRLITSTGRALSGLTVQDTSSAAFDPYFASSSVEGYTQTYSYDDGSNLLQIKHSVSSGGWTQNLMVDTSSNRAIDSAQAKGPVADCFDASGNLLALDSTRVLSWNWRDNVASVVLPTGTEYYVYDGAGVRSRKVRTLSDGSVAEDTIYLGDVELTRSAGVELRWINVGTAQRLEWSDSSQAPQDRYQIADELGSHVLELDDSAAVRTYEEYSPYGGTTLATGGRLADVALKTVRYSGQERDTSTGLYYYGQRYYAPWLGRWISTDPADDIDGLNVYAFARCNPTSFSDTAGLVAKKNKKQKKKAQKQKHKTADIELTITVKSLRKRSKAQLDKMRADVKNGCQSSGRGGGSLGIRCLPAHDPKHPTADVNRANVATALAGNAYKVGMARVHWKGVGTVGNQHSGIPVYPTTRLPGNWCDAQLKKMRGYGALLEKNTTNTPMDNGRAKWWSENSHLLAGSLYGANDMLSAFPASVGQNSEFLAIESGVKKLAKTYGTKLKIMLTGYIRQDAVLSAARYKIVINGKKVFDHLTLGDRGDIDDKEANDLYARVSALTAKSPAAALNPSTAFRGVTSHVINENDMANGQKSSTRSDAFSDLMLASGTAVTDKSKAKAQAEKMWKAKLKK